MQTYEIAKSKKGKVYKEKVVSIAETQNLFAHRVIGSYSLYVKGENDRKFRPISSVQGTSGNEIKSGPPDYETCINLIHAVMWPWDTAIEIKKEIEAEKKVKIEIRPTDKLKRVIISHKNTGFKVMDTILKYFEEAIKELDEMGIFNFEKMSDLKYTHEDKARIMQIKQKYDY